MDRNLSLGVEDLLRMTVVAEAGAAAEAVGALQVDFSFFYSSCF